MAAAGDPKTVLHHYLQHTRDGSWGLSVVEADDEVVEADDDEVLRAFAADEAVVRTGTIEVGKTLGGFLRPRPTCKQTGGPAARHRRPARSARRQSVQACYCAAYSESSSRVPVL